MSKGTIFISDAAADELSNILDELNKTIRAVTSELDKQKKLSKSLKKRPAKKPKRVV